jgi:hypothetical protein
MDGIVIGGLVFRIACQAAFLGGRGYNRGMATHTEHIDELLNSRGFRYDAEDGRFILGDRVVDWKDVIELLPELTLDDLGSYEDAKADAYMLQRRKPK